MKGHSLFTFEDIMENEHESSQQSSTYQHKDDFESFMEKGNYPQPSPVNKRHENDDFFGFG